VPHQIPLATQQPPAQAQVQPPSNTAWTWTAPEQRRDRQGQPNFVKGAEGDADGINALPSQGRVRLLAQALSDEVRPQSPDDALDLATGSFEQTLEDLSSSWIDDLLDGVPAHLLSDGMVSDKPATATLWYLLARAKSDKALEASTPAQATGSAREALKDIFNKPDGVAYDDIEREVDALGRRLTSAMERLDAQEMYAVYRDTHALFSTLDANDVVRIRGDLPGWYAGLRNDPRKTGGLSYDKPLRRADAAFLAAMSDAVNQIATQFGDDLPARQALAHQQLFESVILSIPFVMDVDALMTKEAKSDPSRQIDHSVLEVITSVHSRLSSRGLLPPIQSSSRAKDRHADWRAGRNKIDHVDLPAARPPAAGKRPSAEDPRDLQVVETAPLQHIADLLPRVTQVLDRRLGSVVLTWRDGSKGARMTVSFDPVPDNATQAQIQDQNRQIRLLDDFLLAHFITRVDLAYNSLPPTIGLRDGDIVVGNWRVATQQGDRWVYSSSAVNVALNVLTIRSPGSRRFTETTTAVEPRVQGPLARIRLLLQMGSDDSSTTTARGLQENRLDETVWIQVPESGPVTIVAGRGLLTQVTSDTEVKLEILGHGARIDSTDEMTLQDYSAVALASRVREALDTVLPGRRARGVTLFSCYLDSPVLSRNFPDEFHAAARHADLISQDAEMTAFAAGVAISAAGGRFTRLMRGNDFEYHHPATTFVHTFNSETNAVERRDKHPKWWRAPRQRRDPMNRPIFERASNQVTALLQLRSAQDRIKRLAEALHLSRPSFASSLDQSPVRLRDPFVLATLWQLLAWDVDTPATASPEQARRAAQRAVEARLTPALVGQIQRLLTAAASQLLAGLGNSDPKKLFDAYTNISQGFDLARRGLMLPVVTVRGDLPGRYWPGQTPGSPAPTYAKPLALADAAFIAAMRTVTAQLHLKYIRRQPDRVLMAFAHAMFFQSGILSTPFVVEDSALADGQWREPSTTGQTDGLETIRQVHSQLVAEGLIPRALTVSEAHRRSAEWLSGEGPAPQTSDPQQPAGAQKRKHPDNAADATGSAEELAEQPAKRPTAWMGGEDEAPSGPRTQGADSGKDAAARRPTLPAPLEEPGLADVNRLATVAIGPRSQLPSPRPGRAGALSELVSTLKTTLERCGIKARAAAAPGGVIDAVMKVLTSYDTTLKLNGDLGRIAASIANAVWRNAPAELGEAFNALVRHYRPAGDLVAFTTWRDLPMGLIGKARLPLEERKKYPAELDMPIAEAALVDSAEEAVGAMHKLPAGAGSGPDDLARARQTLALVQAALTGRPFAVDVDAVERMAGSHSPHDHAALSVLAITHGTAMQLHRRQLMEAPIYLSSTARRPDAGWEAHEEGLHLHRGDLLPELRARYRSTIERLRTPLDTGFNDASPLPSLARFMPGATQTLDRKAGTIKIVWPAAPEEARNESLLKFMPSDADPLSIERGKQNDAIRAMDDFIVANFLHEPADSPRNFTPDVLTYEGDELKLGRFVIAKRAGDRWAAPPRVLATDWDGLPDGGNRFVGQHNNFEDNVFGDGPLSPLMERWARSWASESSQVSPSPVPDDLITAARQAFEAQMSAVESKAAEALDIAAKHLADGMWGAKPLLIDLSLTKIAQALGSTWRDLYAIGARPGASASDRSRHMLSAPDTERMVGRANVLLLEGIRAINRRIAAMKAEGKITGDVVSPGMKGQLSHQIEEVLRSVLMRNPLTIDADFIRALAASADPADQARLAAFWKLYPDLRQMADGAALDPPVITWELPNGWTVPSQNDVLTNVPGRPSLARAPDLDDSGPWKLLEFEGEKFVQTLDRAAGTLTLTTIQGRQSFSKTVRFQPWTPDDGEAALRQQDASLRFLEEFCVSHFRGMRDLPHELRLDAGQIKAGGVVLAERTPSGAWRFHLDDILQTSNDSKARWASVTYLPLKDWSKPSRSMATAASTTDPLDRVLIDLQISGDETIQKITEAWVAKNPDKSIWIQWDREESSRVVHGAGLEKRIGPGTEIKLTIHGHGERLWNGGGMTVQEGYDAESLVMAATAALRRYGITQLVDKVVLTGCELESGFAGKSFGSPFLEIAHEEGLVTDSAEVTTFRHGLWTSTGSRAYRATFRHLAAPLLRYAPNVTVIFKRDKVSGAITVEDKYPSGRLRNTVLALGKNLVKAGINPLADPAPAELVDAVHSRLKTLYPGVGDEHAGVLREASRLIAEGLWRQHPRKFQESLRALDRIPLAHSERSWQWPLSLERAMGLVGDTNLPKDLIAQQPDSLLISRTEGALMQGLEAGLPVLERLSPDTGSAATRPALGRQTLALVKAELSGRPYVVELESLDQLSRDTPAGRAGLDVLEAVHGTVKQRSEHGVMGAPIYLTRDAKRSGAGWELHEDGILVHRGDLLPTLLSDRKETIERLRTDDASAEATTADDGLDALLPADGASSRGHGDPSPAVLLDRYPLADADGYGLTALKAVSREEAGHVRPGQAGKLSELWAALEETQARAGIATLEGQAPDEVFEAVKQRLASMYGDQVEVDADLLASAARSLADGLWSRDPAKLREATLAFSRLYGERGPMVARVTWSDLPMGLIDKVRLPGKLLWKHLKAADMPLADVALLCGMESAVRAMEALPGQAARNPVRGALARQTLALVQAALSGRPFTIDADAVTKIALSIEAGGLEHAVLRVLDVVHGAAVQLARKGILPAPVYLADTAPEGTSGWQKYPDGSLVHRGDLLSTLLPRRKQRIEQLQTPADVKVDDARPLPALPDPDSPADSLSSHAVRLAGHDVPAEFLASLGGEIDGKPITGDLLRSIADDPSDPALGLKIDPELFEQWAKLVPEKVDAGVAARARALGRWLAQRKTHDGAGSVFIGEAPAAVEALTARLTAAAAEDAKSSDAGMLKALRGEDARPSSLFGEIFSELDDTTRAGFEAWMARAGIEAEDLLKMAPSSPGEAALDPVEKTIAEIGRRAAQGEDLDIDFEKIQGVNKTNALASLREIGLVKVDGQGVTLDSERLKVLMDGQPGVKLAYADRALRKLPKGVYRSLWKSASDDVRTFMHRSRNQPKPPPKLMRQMDGTVDLVDTVMGIFQLLSHGREMTSAAVGLTTIQLSSVVASPLFMLLGKKLSTLSVVARFKLLRGLSAGLAGGVGNVLMAGVGLAACIAEWDAFVKSGQSTDSYAFKSLIANTVMTGAAVGMAVAGTVIGIKVFLAGAALAAKTALASAAAFMGAASGPFAVILISAGLLAGTLLWHGEYGDYFHESTTFWEQVEALYAKSIGLQTKAAARAEVAKAAVTAQKALSRNLTEQFKDSMHFEMKRLAKQGFGRFFVPDVETPVKSTVFRDITTTQYYNFVMQAKRSVARSFPEYRRPSADSSSATAWLALDTPPQGEFGFVFGLREPKRQLFQGGRLSNNALYGSIHEDIFQVTKPDSITLWGHPERGQGNPAKDEVQIDADGSDVAITGDKTRDGREHTHLIQLPGLGDSLAYGMHRISIRNAGNVKVLGHEDDEQFDILSKSAEIRGHGGNNTYTIRNGNRIFSTSTDMAIWLRGISGAVVDVGDASSKLLLSLDVLHEAVSYRRQGQHLILSVDKDSLTLERYFDRVAPATEGVTTPTNPLTLVDAVGTAVILITPSVIKDASVTSLLLDKHVMHGKATPNSRRTLSAGRAYVRYHLSSGSGEFRVDPAMSTPIEISLDIPVDRLRHVVDGNDVIIVETAPADAAEAFTPLRLRLSGHRLASTKDAPDEPRVWANDKDRKPVILVMPGHDDPAEGPIRSEPPFQIASTDAKDAPSDPPSTQDVAKQDPGQGSDKDDQIDARNLVDGSVLSGGKGADVYLIRAGQSLVINSLARDGALDVLKLEGISKKEFLDGIGLSGSDADLVLELSGGKITILGDATAPQARRLSVEVDGQRFALPVFENGCMVHLPSTDEGDILATAPGSHIVMSKPAAPWDLTAKARKVWMGRQRAFRSHGHALEAQISGDRPSVVTLLDYHRAPEAWELVSHESGDAVKPPAKPVSEGANRIAADLKNGRQSGDDAYTTRDVNGYLRMRGMPMEITLGIRSRTFQQLQRIHELLAIVADGGSWQLPASFIDSFAASDIKVSPGQAALLRHLASRTLDFVMERDSQESGWRHMPWAYNEQVLRRALSMTELQAYESWAADHLGGIGLSDWREATKRLTEFINLLDGKQAPSKGTSSAMLVAVLQLKGRSATAAERLARTMMALGIKDDAWIADMHLAGVYEYTVLARLWNAGILAQDIVLSNANRQSYEEGDRSAWITVEAPTFKSPDTTNHQYVSKLYMKLDETGAEFALKHETRQPGIDYDIEPGQVLNSDGQSPGAPRPHIEERNRKRAEYYAERAKKKANNSYYSSVENSSPIADVKNANTEQGGNFPLPAVVALWQQGLLSHEPVTVPGAWEKRSLPENLVDGHGLAGDTLPEEVSSWRPAATQGLQPSVTPDKSISFKFLHPVALASLELSVSTDAPMTQWLEAARRAGPASVPVARWKVQAIRKDKTRVDVSETFETANGAYTKSMAISTNGVPYSEYEIVGVSGNFPYVWFDEVRFTTTEAGAGTLIDRLQKAGFTGEESRSLALRGIQSDEQIARAGELRRHGGLPWDLIAHDVQTHPRLDKTNLDLLDFIRVNMADRWRHQEYLDAVRHRSGHHLVQLVDRRVEFHRTRTTVAPSLRAQVASWLTDAWDPAEKVRDKDLIAKIADDVIDATMRQGNWLSPAFGGMKGKLAPLPESLTKVDASAWVPAWLQDQLALVPKEGPANDPVVGAEIRMVLDLARRILDAGDAQLGEDGRHGLDLAYMSTTRFQLAVLAAAAYGYEIHVKPSQDTTRQSVVLNRDIEQKLPLLQQEMALGLLDAVLSSTIPPASAAKPWTTRQVNGKTLYIAPAGTPLTAAYAEGRAGQPITRLRNAGIGRDEAEALFFGGITTLKQVERVIRLRDLFGDLPQDAVVKMVHNPAISAGIEQIERLAGQGLASAEDIQKSLEAGDDARLPGTLRVSILSAQLWDSTGSPLLHDDFLFTFREQVIGWLTEFATNPFSVRTVSRSLVRMASAHWIFGPDALTDALVRGRHSSFVHDDSSLVESSDWVPDRLGPSISLIPGEGGAKVSKPDGAAYVMLRIVKRFYDTIEAELLKKGHGSDEVAQAMDPLYLKLEALRASVTGMRLDLQEPQGASTEAVRVRALLAGLRPALERAQLLKLLDVSFSTGGAETETETDSVNEPGAGPEPVGEAPATEAPADPVTEAGSIQKAAELLKQGIASQPDAGSAGISSFAPPVRPPSPPLLATTA